MLIKLFDALPADEQTALLEDVVNRHSRVARTSFVPATLDESARNVRTTWWLLAIEEFEVGKPERLAELLQSCEPLIPFAGTYLAKKLVPIAKRPSRGRPPKVDDYQPQMLDLLEVAMREHVMSSEFRQAVERFRAMPKSQREDTPTKLATAEVAKKHGMTPAAVHNFIYGKPPRYRKSRN